MDGSFSRARPEGHGKPPPRPGRIALVCALAALALLGAWKAVETLMPEREQAQTRRTPSGLPVPRYVSLKFDEVNARGGPGDDYRLLWTYRARGLPLQVIAETADWRRVCDPEGAVAWVHQRTVDTRRTVMRTAAETLPIRRRPEAASAVVAELAGRALASLEECRDDGWCRISAGKAQGWVPASAVWGAAEGAQCRPAPPRPG